MDVSRSSIESIENRNYLHGIPPLPQTVKYVDRRSETGAVAVDTGDDGSGDGNAPESSRF
jgi:hypothetical protein